MPLPFVMIFLNITTYMMFPGVALSASIASLNSNWSSICIVACYNFINLVAKFLTNFRFLYSNKITFTLVFLRPILYIIFLINATENTFLNNSFIILFNIGLFSFVDGFGIGSLFVLASEKAVEEK